MFSLAGRTDAEETFTKSAEDFACSNNSSQLNASSDIEIRSSSKVVLTNKATLSCFSSFFEHMFKTEMKEKYEKSIELRNIDGDTLLTIIDFFYSGHITINSENVCDLLFTSDYLMIEDLKKFCFVFLGKVLSSDNCIFIAEIANHYHNIQLTNNIQQFIVEKFEEVICSTDFEKFSKEELQRFLSVEIRSAIEEDLFFKAVTSWTKHEPNREKHFSELFKNVDLKKISSSFLKNVISKEELVRNNSDCCGLLIDILLTLVPDEGITGNESAILSLSGDKSKQKVVEVFNCLKAPSLRRSYPQLPEGRSRGCAVKIDTSLYFIGGFSTHFSTNHSTVWKLDLKEDKPRWQPKTSMKNNRCSIACACYKGNIVVCGGWNEGCFATVEYYSPLWNSWTDLQPMTFARNAHALVACKGYLFAIGGFGQSSCLSSVERLKPGDHIWTIMEPMQTSRSYHAAAYYNGYIYVFGGNVGSTTFKSCEKYDVERNEWTSISDMNFPRSKTAACVLRGKIYVVGGIVSTNKTVNEIECYYPPSNQWSIVRKTSQKLCGHALVAV